MTDLLALEAIRIADKHLGGESPDKREALAKDIVLAIIRHAEVIAMDAISRGWKPVS